jgi:hypothetical protein
MRFNIGVAIVAECFNGARMHSFEQQDLDFSFME